MSEVFEVNYSPGQIDYWIKSYRRKTKRLYVSINDIEDKKVVQAFLDIHYILHQIKCHLICNAEFLQKVEEKLYHEA